MRFLKTREELEEEELAQLAPWGMASRNSRGRAVAEEPHPCRTHFQRDRARVIHSSAFRRLDGKTQVFLNGTGDHYRTRLTHTIEVASLARTLARALGLNEDLAETIALAHDLGHPPLGHTGEEALDELMREHGGFDHNEQSVRIVEVLEEKYPHCEGLNLSVEVLEGMRKHGPVPMLPDGRAAAQIALEGQAADVADEITYHSHDLDDGLDARLLDGEKLRSVELWCRAVEKARGVIAAPDARRDRGFIIRCLINLLAEDVIEASSGRLLEARPGSPEEARLCGERLLGFSRELAPLNTELKRFLYRELYHHPEVAGVHRRHREALERVFMEFLRRPELLGEKARKRVGRDGLHRAVCDYLAGMTDRFFLRTCERLGLGVGG